MPGQKDGQASQLVRLLITAQSFYNIIINMLHFIYYIISVNLLNKRYTLNTQPKQDRHSGLNESKEKLKETFS